jgi:hypothetical protein
MTHNLPLWQVSFGWKPHPSGTPQYFGFWNFSVLGRNIVRIIIAIPSSEIPFLAQGTISGVGNDLGMTSG